MLPTLPVLRSRSEPISSSGDAATAAPAAKAVSTVGANAWLERRDGLSVAKHLYSTIGLLQFGGHSADELVPIPAQPTDNSMYDVWIAYRLLDST